MALHMQNPTEDDVILERIRDPIRVVDNTMLVVEFLIEDRNIALRVNGWQPPNSILSRDRFAHHRQSSRGTDFPIVAVEEDAPTILPA